MKNLTTALALSGILLLLSCTKTVYTHEQVLDSYKTKQDVARKFGRPKEKQTTDNAERWLYKYEGHSPADRISNEKVAYVTELGKYDRYLIFSFNNQGNVTGWNCAGVSFAYKKPNITGTALLVAGVIVFIVALFITVPDYKGSF
jgi:hypothetical protein